MVAVTRELARWAVGSRFETLPDAVRHEGRRAFVNFVGCVLFGAIAGAAEQRVQLAPELRAFLLVGVLGGFTTFSSYAFESFSLLRDGQFAAAAVNIVGQVIAALVGLWAGYVLTN